MPTATTWRVSTTRARASARCPCPLHRAEAAFLSEPMLNLSAMLGRPVTAAAPDVILDGGETLDLEGTSWRVVHAPGHSPGSVLYVHDDSNQAIVGDTLFAGSIGRSDFPTSNVDDLRHTITRTLMDLPRRDAHLPGPRSGNHDRHRAPVESLRARRLLTSVRRHRARSATVYAPRLQIDRRHSDDGADRHSSAGALTAHAARHDRLDPPTTCRPAIRFGSPSIGTSRSSCSFARRTANSSC